MTFRLSEIWMGEGLGSAINNVNHRRRGYIRSVVFFPCVKNNDESWLIYEKSYIIETGLNLKSQIL